MLCGVADTSLQLKLRQVLYTHSLLSWKGSARQRKAAKGSKKWAEKKKVSQGYGGAVAVMEAEHQKWRISRGALFLGLSKLGTFCVLFSALFRAREKEKERKRKMKTINIAYPMFPVVCSIRNITHLSVVEGERERRRGRDQSTFAPIRPSTWKKDQTLPSGVLAIFFLAKKLIDWLIVSADRSKGQVNFLTTYWLIWSVNHLVNWRLTDL